MNDTFPAETVDHEPRSARFGSLDIAFDDRVLTPRPWTAAQSDWAADLIVDAPEGPVLELCAGAGQIGLRAVRNTNRELVLVDRDATACEYSRLNAKAARPGGGVDVRQSSLDEALRVDEAFAVIMADPPWVPSAGVSQFPEDPLSAIDGGHDGLDIAWSCLMVIADHLMDGGSAIIQLGALAQSAALSQHLLERPDLGLAPREERTFADGVLLLVTRTT